MAHIANGQDWFGGRVKAAPAVYVLFEGQGGIPNRVNAWRMGVAKLRKPEALMIAAPPDDITTNRRFIMDPINLREAADRDKLVTTLTECKWAGGVLCIDTLVHASLPSRLIERGRPGPGFLAHVLVSKYAGHLPLYRQSQIFEREGLDLDRSTWLTGLARPPPCWNPWPTPSVAMPVGRGDLRRRHAHQHACSRHRQDPDRTVLDLCP